MPNVTVGFTQQLFYGSALCISKMHTLTKTGTKKTQHEFKYDCTHIGFVFSLEAHKKSNDWIKNLD